MIKPLAWAVRNDQGYWSGLWNTGEQAELICALGHHNEVVVPLIGVHAAEAALAEVRKTEREWIAEQVKDWCDIDGGCDFKQMILALPDEQAIARQTGTIGHVSHNMPAANAIAQQEKGESVADQHFRQNTETWKGIS